MLIATVGATLSSCDVHEFPADEKPEVQLLLDFADTAEMPLYKDVEYGNGDVLKTTRQPLASSENFSVRHTIVAYAVDNSGKMSEEPAMRTVVTRPVAGGLDAAVSISLDRGKYVFYVWTDYVAKGTAVDLYYDTSALSDITYVSKGDYHGSDDMRDCFRGEAAAAVGNGSATVKVRMERPLGKFVFITNDASRLTPETLAGYTVVFRYCGYMPSVFSLFQNKPIDSWQGVSFSSNVAQADGNEATLGFDYVMMNGKETTVPIALEIYDGEKRRVAATEAVDVPLMRNKLTVVRGQFLTSKAAGGVDIKVDFDGEYDYEAD